MAKLPSEHGKAGNFAVGERLPEKGDHVDFYNREGEKRYGQVTHIDVSRNRIHIKDHKSGETHKMVPIKESMNEENRYPDSEEGAKNALADMSIHKREHITYATPDPHAKGVWKVGVNHPKHGKSTHVVYLGGHGTHKRNDFETIHESMNDDSKRYLEPSAPAEKATWMAHKVQRYTQPYVPDYQFSGGTKHNGGHIPDSPDTRKDNGNERNLGMVELPGYLKTVKDAINGSRAGKTVSAVKEAVELTEALGDYKKKPVRGLYSYTHFEHPNGSFVQIHNGKKFKAVHQDKDGNQKTFHDYDELKSHVNSLKEEVELEEQAHIIIDTREKKVVGREPNRTKANAKALKLDIATGHNDRHQIRPVQEETRIDEAFPPKKDAVEDGNGDEKADKKGISSGLGGSEVKTQLETLALQAAELFAEVDEKQAFDAEIKDALETAVEALGKVHATIMDSDEGEEDEDTDNQNKPDYKEEGGDEDEPKKNGFQKEDVELNEISKDLVGRYLKKSVKMISHHNAAIGRALDKDDTEKADYHQDQLEKRAQGAARAQKRLNKFSSDSKD